MAVDNLAGGDTLVPKYLNQIGLWDCSRHPGTTWSRTSGGGFRYEGCWDGMSLFLPDLMDPLCKGSSVFRC